MTTMEMTETGEMTETYTYTARNADDPDRMVTFTLANGHVHLNLSGVMEQVSKISAADEKGAEAREQLQKQMQPAAMKVAETLSGPIEVGDVEAHLDGERLKLWAWQRVGGLRLAPMAVKIGRVDNVEAAEAFVEELDERKTSAAHAGKFFGPLDYWLGWAALLVAVIALLRWPGRRN